MTESQFGVVVLELWDGPLPAPWSRPEGGRLERLVVRSAVLEGNPLGDSAMRPLWVYVPPRMAELTGHGIAHRFELFPGTHSGVEHRYPLAVRALAFALAAR
jgi:hypothetical protein